MHLTSKILVAGAKRRGRLAYLVGRNGKMSAVMAIILRESLRILGFHIHLKGGMKLPSVMQGMKVDVIANGHHDGGQRTKRRNLHQIRSWMRIRKRIILMLKSSL